MPGKKAKEVEMPTQTATEPKVKPVRLDLTADVHRLLRLVAADAGMSMAAYARQSFEKLIREEAGRKGIKG